MIDKEIGGFKIVSELGRGGMGMVYKAYQTSLERHVAIKTIPFNLAGDKTLLERFYVEAKTIAKLNHPNIVHIYDVFEIDGVHYIAMEYIEGVTLGKLIRKKGSIEPDMAIFLLKSIADALAKAHDNNIIHRDIKPDNIMITHDNRVKLMDFGLARNSAMQGQTIAGHIMGTPEYMSPEQCEGKLLDGQTDLYSLGMTIFEALAKTTPFAGKTLGEIIHAKTCGPATKFEQFRSDLPRELQYIINKLTEHDQQFRYQNAHELVRDIEKANFDLSAAPDKMTIIVDTLSDINAPTMTVIKNSLLKNVKQMGIKERLAYYSLAFLIFFGLFWGMREIKENIDIKTLLAPSKTLTENETKQIEEYLNLARQEFDSKQYSAAIDHLSALLAIDNRNTEAKELKDQIMDLTILAKNHYDNGIKYMSEYDFEEAVNSFENAYNIYPDGYGNELIVNIVKCYVPLGTLALEAQLYSQAIIYYEKALHYAPDNTVVLANISGAYFMQKDYESCIKYCLKALESNTSPSEPDKYFSSLFVYLARSYNSLGRHDEAVNYLEEGIKKVEGPRREGMLNILKQLKIDRDRANRLNAQENPTPVSDTDM